MGDIPILGQRQPGQQLDEMQVRLLICNDCKQIEELPDFEGHPDDDHLLKIAIQERHTWPTGTEHTGNMARIALKFWANPKVREGVIKQIQAGASGGMDDLEAGWYDSKSQFQIDAMECYKKHLRPVGRCPDWKHESKKLIPKTAAERKDAGMAAPGKNGAPINYLCSFCPAATYMHTKQRELRGLYN